MFRLKEEMKKIKNAEYPQEDHKFYDPGLIFCRGLYFILHLQYLKHRRGYWQ